MTSTVPQQTPVGGGLAVPQSRSLAQAWAAPRAADLILDPWAAPAGPPLATYLMAPWPAPDPAFRVVGMAPPAALVTLTDLWSTDTVVAIEPAVPPAPAPAPVEPTAVETVPTVGAIGRLRARMWAMAVGGFVAVVGTATLAVAVF